MLVSEMISEFLKHKQSRKKPNTYRFYEGRLVALEKRLGSKKARKLTRDDLEQYLTHANTWQVGPHKGTPKAPDTVRGTGVALKQLQQFAIKRKWLKKPWIEDDDIPMPVGRNRQRMPTAEEVQQIKSVSSPAFCLVLAALRRSGARPNEIARATVADWDQVIGVITLADHKTAGKTGQPRTIVTGKKLTALILESLNGRTEGRLFLKPLGAPWDSNSLSAAFRRARDLLELDKRLVIYTNRHGHATAMYEKLASSPHRCRWAIRSGCSADTPRSLLRSGKRCRTPCQIRIKHSTSINKEELNARREQNRNG